MIVVSDTSPLRYLIAVEHIEILAQLFLNIHVPPAVIQELSHFGAPPAIRRWVSSRPAWLTVDSLRRPLDAGLLARLDRGEAEAIQLAEEKTADLLIMDEWKGRSMARERALPLTGSLGILGLAYQRKLLENPIDVLSAMRAEGFRIQDALIGRFERLLQTRFAR